MWYGICIMLCILKVVLLWETYKQLYRVDVIRRDIWYISTIQRRSDLGLVHFFRWLCLQWRDSSLLSFRGVRCRTPLISLRKPLSGLPFPCHLDCLFLRFSGVQSIYHGLSTAGRRWPEQDLGQILSVDSVMTMKLAQVGLSPIEQSFPHQWMPSWILPQTLCFCGPGKASETIWTF